MPDHAKRIACLGDSNTFGYAPGAPLGGRYPASVRWTGRLAEAAGQVFNRGQNGALIPRTGEYGAFAALVQSLLPLDALCVMYGTNDILHFGTAAAAGERMEAFLRALRPAAGGAKILLIAPVPLICGDWVRDAAVIAESKALAEAYRRAADAQRVAFADAAAWGVGLEFDGVHFTAAGHAAFFAGVHAALSTL